MSHEISCRDAIAKLWDFLDEELDAEGCAQMREHLERCRACFPHYDFQRAYRDFMASCRNDCAPPELRRRIFMRLLQEPPTD